MHLIIYIFRSLLILGSLRIGAFTIIDFENKFSKVAPVLWKEADYGIKSEKRSPDTLIVTYLNDPCFLFENSSKLYLKICKNQYNKLINDIITRNCKLKIEDTKKNHQQQMSQKSRSVLKEENLIIVGSLLVGLETFETTKRMKGNYQTKIEQNKSVKPKNLPVQQFFNVSISLDNDELELLDIYKLLYERMMETTTKMERFFQKFHNNQDISKEFKQLFGDLIICEKDGDCPIKFAITKGFYH